MNKCKYEQPIRIGSRQWREKVKCNICEFQCTIPENGTGRCRMYTNTGNSICEIYPDTYLLSVPAPIEAMPMTHFYPNSRFLQVATFGCNFKCSGCVSWIMTLDRDAISDAVYKIDAKQLVKQAVELKCKGIMFCFNEPAVSFFTFKKLADCARKNGLLVGCATNGYFTASAFNELLEHIDFINIGLKGHSNQAYEHTGAKAFTPIYRNLESSLKSRVHTEVAAVYLNGREEELIRTARHVASLSKDTPFQVMRFMPLAHSEAADEPTIKSAEKICRELKQFLNHVYLFNSPGTDLLDTTCPACKKQIIKRGFNGPMCSHVIELDMDTACGKDHSELFTGEAAADHGLEALGFFGGYKNILTLENIRTVLAFLGETDPQIISQVIHSVLKSGFIKTLYPKMKRIDSYFETIDHYAALAGRQREAGVLRAFVDEKLNLVTSHLKNDRAPAVYFALGNPLIAVFGDKFECNLVELAGGRCVNKDIQREDIPGSTISPDLLNRLNPDIILIHGAIGYPISDVLTFCEENRIRVNAIKNKQVYNLHPYRAAGRPDWILGFLCIANILHPDTFQFKVDDIANQLYQTLFGTDYAVLNHNLAFDVLLSEKLKNLACG